MKIVIDARLYGLEHAGLGRYTMNLVDNLAKIDKKNSYILLLRKKYFNKLKLPKNWKKVLADFRHYTFTEQLKLPIILYKEKGDLVHFPHFNLPILYFGQFVITLHDVLMHKFTSGAVTTLPPAFYQVRRLGYKIAFFKAVKGSKTIIAPSEDVKKDLLKYYDIKEDKIVVTYQGFDKKIKLEGVNKKAILGKYKLGHPYFIYAGNAYPHKNLDKVIKAIVSLNKNIKPNVLFAIATARGVFYERLKKRIELLGAEKYVKLLGFVPDEDLGAILTKSIAFVYPSLSEGFGLQGIEAMAAGTLVLASEIAVFKEVYQDNAIYFNPKDHRSIFKAMEKAIEVEDRARVIKKAQKFIKRYSWTKMAKETLQIYQTVIG